MPYFARYELRQKFTTRLSAGGVADHMVTRVLRQESAEVFKREALAKLGRQANECGVSRTQLKS